MKKNILILFGGKSTEHDISIISTFYVNKFVDEYLYNVYLVYIDKCGNFNYLKNVKTLNDFINTKKIIRVNLVGKSLYENKDKKLKKVCDIDCVLPIMHGVNGEDGSVDGFLKLNNIARATPNIDVAAIGMDKGTFKKCVGDVACVLNCVEVTNKDLYNDKQIINKIKENIGFPCIIKPARQGSSIGIEICENEENLLKLIKKCLKFDKKLIIEPKLTKFREFNIAIYKTSDGLKISEIEEPILKSNMLSFEEKYLNFSGIGADKIKKIPPKISKNLYEEIVKMASDVYECFDASGVIRFDFIYNTINKKLYLNEMNTIPGSLALYLFAAKGIGEDKVLNDIITYAIRQNFLENAKQIDYKTQVLNSTNLAKFKKWCNL